MGHGQPSDGLAGLMAMCIFGFARPRQIPLPSVPVHTSESFEVEKLKKKKMDPKDR